MKHKFSFVNTLWWVFLLGFLGGILFWLAPKHERISQTENRILAGLPSLTINSIVDSTFMSNVEKYIADGFFQRLIIIHISNDIKGFFDMRSTDELLDMDMEEAVNEFMSAYEEDDLDITTTTEQNNGNSTPTENSKETLVPTSIDENVIHDEQTDTDNPSITDAEYTFWLDLDDGTKKLVYDYPKENLDISINALNAYRQALPKNGELHFMQIPYAGLANMIYKWPKTYVGWDCDAEDYMQQHAVEGVHIHNVTDYLEKPLIDGEKLYFNTDYHWAPLGAYYAHVGIMTSQNLPYLRYEDYDYTIHDDFLGRSYLSTLANQLENIADRLEVIHPIFPTSSFIVDPLPEETEIKVMSYNRNNYLAYLGGTRGPWRKFITGADTGRKALIVSDSFGNVFAPYMFAYYDEVHMLDLRPKTFTKRKSEACVKDYIEYYEIDDAYIMLATSSSMNSAYMLEYLMDFLDY
ncbi:MAG: hypothetical protein KAQ68_04290 [Clostridiales bacterium]|nr:hypothetical protein [Clostridiales bacterium]